MNHQQAPKSAFGRFKHTLLGAPRDPHARDVFHSLSLIAFFAWVGLGADGLSSTCYGPQEAFLALGNRPHLGLFVALATAVTIFVLAASYSQIIELFPSGGGGYVVASKLLSPRAGMVAGAALLIDYVLTIAISLASGADAVFSFLPAGWQPAKLYMALLGIILLTIMNLRGIKESVWPLVPVFMIFVLTHAAALLYAFFAHADQFPVVVRDTAHTVSSTSREIGWLGLLALILRAYGMGAGTYTGIEAVSNSMTLLREPRVQTARKTMRYMAVSLAVTAVGLLVAYLLYGVRLVEGKTLNAVLLEGVVEGWPSPLARTMIMVTLFSEAAILFIAAQAGFLSGPRVLANMALDRWVPTRFASLSDRLVTHHGILLMGGSAFVTVLLTGGAVQILVVLYSINVFITFFLSQLGMVRYAWDKRRDPAWRRRLNVNGAALVLTTFILVTMIALKFHDGGWITLLVTGGVIGLMALVRGFYNRTVGRLGRLDGLVAAADLSEDDLSTARAPFNARDKTAVVLVNGFNGFGLHTLFGIWRLFGDTFRNFVFIQVGMIDAGNFKGVDEMDRLREHVASQLDRYVRLIERRGFHGESMFSLGIDALEEISELVPAVVAKYPRAVFFGGQLTFPESTVHTRWLHNYLVMAVQARLHHMGYPFIIIPVRVQAREAAS